MRKQEQALKMGLYNLFMSALKIAILALTSTEGSGETVVWDPRCLYTKVILRESIDG